MKTTLFTFLTASAFVFAACDNAPKKQEPTEAAESHNEAKIDNSSLEDDAEFLVEAADGNMFEIELGKLAQKNGKSADVKSFGKMMADDHSKMLDEMKTLAASKNITLPTDMSDDHRKELEKFTNKAGKEFDKDYIDAMEDDHEKDLKAFEDQSTKDKSDADIRNFAIGALPKLREHLAHVKHIEEKHDAMKKK